MDIRGLSKSFSSKPIYDVWIAKHCLTTFDFLVFIDIKDIRLY